MSASAPPFAFDRVVRLTKLGAGYLVFTLVIGFAALNTGNNSLYIGLAFMLGGLLVSGLASKGGLKGLSVELLGVDETWAGSPAEALLRVHNGSRIWNVRDVVVVADVLEAPVLIGEVPRRGAVDVPMRFLFERRGPVRFAKVDLYTRYPFGLILKKRRAKFEGEILVYPRLLGGSTRRVTADAKMSDVVPRRRMGMGTDVFAFREYVRGDSLRHVHWKKSASLGRWVIKQHQEEGAPAVQIAVDPVKPAGVTDEQFERMISEAATLLHEAIELEAEVALILPAERIRGRGSRVRRSVFEALALIEPEPSGDLPVVPRGATLFSLRSEDAKSA